MSKIEPVAHSDREMLLYLMQAFDSETWQCPHCGHAEDTRTMDSAIFLREYLEAYPASAITELERENAELAANLAKAVALNGELLADTVPVARFNKLAGNNAELVDYARKLKLVLKSRGKHTKECNFWTFMPLSKCDCGLDDAIALPLPEAMKEEG